MRLSGIDIQLTHSAGRLKAFCCLTFDECFVVRDVKLIDGDTGLFLAMPSRKICDHCPRCREKNHLRARFCNNCGLPMDENRGADGPERSRLHADIAHPVNADTRRAIEKDVLAAYHREVERSREPNYVGVAVDVDVPEPYRPRRKAM
ncbi:MAG: septation protein SpoVG family protein [Phycisphaerae bacterium]